MSTKHPDIFESSILIIDDIHSNAETLTEMLNMAGFQSVVMLCDPRKALELITQNCPDLIILDFHMPHINGLELLELMKSRQLLNEKMDVVMLTGDNDMNSKVKALSIGASDFITKPFSFLEVKTRIQNLLHKQNLYTQLDEHNRLLEERVRERTAALLHINDVIVEQNENLKKLNWMQSHVLRAPLARFLSIADLLTIDNSLSKEDFAQLLQNGIDSALEVDGVIKDMSKLAWESQLLDTTNEQEDPTNKIENK